MNQPSTKKPSKTILLRPENGEFPTFKLGDLVRYVHPYHGAVDLDLTPGGKYLVLDFGQPNVIPNVTILNDFGEEVIVAAARLELVIDGLP